jgi:hypothetical protein
MGDLNPLARGSTSRLNISRVGRSTQPGRRSVPIVLHDLKEVERARDEYQAE